MTTETPVHAVREGSLVGLAVAMLTSLSRTRFILVNA